LRNPLWSFARIVAPRGSATATPAAGGAPALAEPLEIRDGNAIVPERPGNGLVRDEAAVERYPV
jgi:L-alanine-DL-glutamate epimerase-like enolase superfamily enzyme